MKKIFLNLAILAFATVFVLSSCKKNDEEVTTEEASISSSDASTAREEGDQAINEASSYTENSSFGSTIARIDAPANPDSITVTAIDDKGGAKTAYAYPKQRKVILKFDNSESKDGQRTRTGTIIAQLDTTGTNPKVWSDQGAVLKVIFVNLKVTNIASGKSILINGEHIVTNVTGGRAIYALITPNSSKVSHSISGTMKAAFDGGSERNWSISRKREFEYFKITLSSSNVEGGIVETGTNRFGTNFTNKIVTPIVIERLTCTNKTQNRITSGKYTHEVGNKTNTIEFGYNVSGTMVSENCSKTSAKITYTKRNNTQGEFILTLYRNF